MAIASARAAREARVVVERGFLVIADISGYTDYVVASPLVHAEDVLADVTATVAQRLAGVVRVNKMEGDAVFGYALDGDTDASTFLDAIEAAYAAFRQRVEGIGHATSCDCKACTKLPDLDLKVVLHHGEFARRPGRGGEELTGKPVIAVHRLLKNSVGDVFGTRGYALLTEESVSALGIDAEKARLRPHREAFPDVGEQRLHLLDLSARYEEARGARAVVVQAEEAVFEVERIVAAPPPVTWEHLTAPPRRARWYGSAVEQVTEGRRGAGTLFCVDARAQVYEEVLDWRPFEYFTESRTLRRGARLILTTELEPMGDKTRVRTRASALDGRRGPLARLEVRTVRRRLEDGYARLAAVLEHEPGAAAGPSVRG